MLVIHCITGMQNNCIYMCWTGRKIAFQSRGSKQAGYLEHWVRGHCFLALPATVGLLDTELDREKWSISYMAVDKGGAKAPLFWRYLLEHTKIESLYFYSGKQAMSTGGIILWA